MRHTRLVALLPIIFILFGCAPKSTAFEFREPNQQTIEEHKLLEADVLVISNHMSTVFIESIADDGHEATIKIIPDTKNSESWFFTMDKLDGTIKISRLDYSHKPIPVEFSLTLGQLKELVWIYEDGSEVHVLVGNVGGVVYASAPWHTK